MNKLTAIIMGMIISINIGARVLDKNEFLNDFSGQYIVINVSNKAYCIEVTKTELIPVNNIQGCQKINDISIMNKGVICIDDSKIVCKKIQIKSSDVFWGSTYKIKFKQSKQELEQKNTSLNINNSQKNGKKYYIKARNFFRKKQYHEAYKWAKKSADLGYKGGYFGMGLAFEKGYGVVNKDKNKAIEWYLKAAKLGHTNSQYKLGRLFMFDDGEKAEKWYKKAANKGHLAAQNNLGYMYKKGMGSSIWGNAKLAHKYYLMAAKQGNKVSQYNVCLNYWKGDGVDKDKEKAIKWCQKSTDKGYSKASDVLERIKSEF